MASTTVDPPPLLQLDAILTVDLRLLTQSELYSLSLCSHSSFNSRLCDDVVLPKIDPSVFNESAGSRKQTYSRLRLAPPSSNPIPRGRTLHLRSCTTHPEKEENALIIYLLKQLFTPREEHITDELVRVEYTPHLPNAIIPFGKKRKRARPRKDEYFVVGPIESSEVRGELSVVKENGDREIVNVNGNVVDLVALGRVDNPYGGELRRMTKALKNEEEFLGFLKGLNGRWGSRRKKKRIVDAGEFGDVLPKGWKVMLSVKKKEGHVWLFCRSYISPSGKQFASCKEVSSYLLSLFGLKDANQSNCAHSAENIQSPYNLASGNAAEPAVQEENKKENLILYSSPNITSISSTNEKRATLKIGDPVEVQVEEIKCHKCTLTFDQMDDLLHHQVSSHRGKRSKMGSSLTDGVIIRGGKYECQFCHKTFEERHRYNGHIGVHVKNQLKNAEASPK